MHIIKSKKHRIIEFSYRNENVYHEDSIYTPNSTIDEAREWEEKWHIFCTFGFYDIPL